MHQGHLPLQRVKINRTDGQGTQRREHGEKSRESNVL